MLGILRHLIALRERKPGKSKTKEGGTKTTTAPTEAWCSPLSQLGHGGGLFLAPTPARGPGLRGRRPCASLEASARGLGGRGDGEAFRHADAAWASVRGRECCCSLSS